MAYEAEGQRIATQLQEQFGRLLEARLDSPITLVFEHGQWVVPSNFIFKFGYTGSGPDCFHAFLEAAGFHVTKSQVEHAKPGELFRAPGYAPVDPAAVAAHEAAARRDQARKDHERAVGLMDQGQLREALNLFIAVRVAIVDDPHPMNLLNIAVCHARLGEFKESLAVLEDAMRLWPDDERLRANYEAIRDDAPKPSAAPRPAAAAAAASPPPLAPSPEDLRLPPLAPPPSAVVSLPPYAKAAPARVQSSVGVSSPPPPIPPIAPPAVPPPSHHPAPAAISPEPAGPTKMPPGYDDGAATFIRGAGTPLPGVTPGLPATMKPPVPAPKPAVKAPAKPPARAGNNNNAIGLAALGVVAALVVGVSGWWILSSDSADPAPAATEQPAPSASQPAAPAASPAPTPATSAPPPIVESPAAPPPVAAPLAPESPVVAPPAPPNPPPPSRPASRPAPAAGARGAAPGGARTPAQPEPGANAPDSAAGRAAARREFDQGTAAEGTNDLTSALQHFQAARRLDGTFAEAQAAITRVTGRMNTEGNDAFVRARQYDALDRTEQAITWYERAFRSLPDDNPNRRVARERLDALRRR